MKFIVCQTDRYDYVRNDVPGTIGAPRTAACWFYDQLPEEERKRPDLRIHVAWWDDGMRFATYGKNERGVLSAL